MVHSLPLIKFRAPHRDARHTLSAPTRRAPRFFSCARLCATFVGSSANHRATCQLACFARLSTGGASLQKLASRCASASWWFMWDGGLVHSCNYRRCKAFVGQNKSKKNNDETSTEMRACPFSGLPGGYLEAPHAGASQKNAHSLQSSAPGTTWPRQ